MILRELLKVVPTESEVLVEEYISRDRRELTYATWLKRFEDRGKLARVMDCEVLSVHSSGLYSGKNAEMLTIEILN